MAAYKESLHAEGEKRVIFPPAANIEWLLVSIVL